MSTRIAFQVSVVNKAQADGAQEIDASLSVSSDYEPKKFWQIQIIPSATPSAGTMAVAVKTPGASGFSTLPTTIDMTSTELTVTFEAAVEAIRLTPVSFDAAKTYSAYICAI